jgi:hypothetical protein
MSKRLVAVLGYSGRRTHGLHAVCVARLRHAERVASGDDTVLLSGWARRGNAAEAELMHDAWEGADVVLIADRTARNTRENALRIAEAAVRLRAREVTVVTSQWHAFRAARLVRNALPGVPITTSSPPGRPSLALAVRELLCVAALPLLRGPARR